MFTIEVLALVENSRQVGGKLFQDMVLVTSMHVVPSAGLNSPS